MTPEEFKTHVSRLAKVVGVEAKQIHLRKMKRKWASCSSRGRLTFDPDLLYEPKEMWVKAVLHELLHMRYPNHGKMFEMMLQTYLSKEMANKYVDLPNRANSNG
ncbi:MAG TPA: M48 family metallopeptidase [Syntrophobacteraceae bacterium]|nr:M48 family metallopeptidase [Syntrophobacteraceae bacterium]